MLVDGAHGSFPYPILDWWHLAVRVRGTMLLDDAYLHRSSEKP